MLDVVALELLDLLFGEGWHLHDAESSHASGVAGGQLDRLDRARMNTEGVERIDAETVESVERGQGELGKRDGSAQPV